MENILDLKVHAKDNTSVKQGVNVKRVCNAVYCSSDVNASRKSLDAKAAEGYQVSKTVPNIQRRSRYLVTNENVIEVQGGQTSGEAEYVAIVDRSRIMITVGSDHNDRSLGDMWAEGLGKLYGSAKSKQIVPAVVAKDAWRYEDVREHWNKLSIKSYVTLSGKRNLYQNFTLADLVDLEYLFERNPWLRESGTVIFGGTSARTERTLPKDLFQFQDSIRGLRFPTDFQLELFDPVLKRSISHSYDVERIGEEGLLGKSR